MGDPVRVVREGPERMPVVRAGSQRHEGEAPAQGGAGQGTGGLRTGPARPTAGVGGRGRRLADAERPHPRLRRDAGARRRPGGAEQHRPHPAAATAATARAAPPGRRRPGRGSIAAAGNPPGPPTRRRRGRPGCGSRPAPRRPCGGTRVR
eukprot:2000712-Pleurochrysis_carterae.AAC.1